MKAYKNFLGEAMSSKNFKALKKLNKDTNTRAEGEKALSQLKKDNNKEAESTVTSGEYRSSMSKAAEKEASREKYEKPEVKRRAAQEPVSGEKVKRKAELLKRVQAKRGQKPQGAVKRYATAYGSERLKKEKDRIKTDPVGAVKGYASRAGKIGRGAVNLIKSRSSEVGTSEGGSGPNSTQFKRG